jgi:hypothetical protein
MRLSGNPQPTSGNHAIGTVRPARIHPQNRRVRLLRLLALSVLGLSAAMWAVRAAAQQPGSTFGEQESLHETEQWRQVQAHLPDP